jgi:hypothetical protein
MEKRSNQKYSIYCMKAGSIGTVDEPSVQYMYSAYLRNSVRCKKDIRWTGTVLYLKVVGNENQGRSGRWHTFGIGLGPWRSMFFYLLI